MKKIISILLLSFASILTYAQPKPGSFKPTWEKGPEWLKNAVIYQIYPSSFKDSDGNGIGDIPGVISKLDYIESLGVDVIWFNPLFSSTWIDGGYDITDFYSVDNRFGTNDDLVELIRQAHSRGIRVMLDLVAGHTSYLHPWFQESSKYTNHRYSDYYIWSDVLPDKKAEADLEKMLKSPDYMQSTTGKWMSGDYPRAKYYYKNFYACQPALNYGYAKPDPSHPWEQSVDDEGPRAVRQELKNIMAFWYGKGIDGFRVDMANSLVKGDSDKSTTIKVWREMREWSDKNYPDRVLMAEWGSPKYCLASGFNVDMDLNSVNKPNRRLYFDNKHQADGGSYFSLNGGAPSRFDLYGKPWPRELVDSVTTPYDMLKRYYDYITDCFEWVEDWGYIASITGNHDHLRLNTGARNTPEQLKMMMTWIMMMPLPILYYGDEIGLRSLVDMPNVEGANHNGKERSGARTPMQWDSSANAGFSSCSPENLYLPVCPEWTSVTSYKDYVELKKQNILPLVSEGMISVESQQDDPNSLLNWVRTLIRFRKENEAFWADSAFEPLLDETAPYPMVFLRKGKKETFAVVINPTGLPQHTSLKSSRPSSKYVSSGKVEMNWKQSRINIDLAPVSCIVLKIGHGNDKR